MTALDDLIDGWDRLTNGETPTTKAIRQARDRDGNRGPGWFWTQTEWAEWANELAALVPEDDWSCYSGNVDGPQEPGLVQVFTTWATQRQAVLDIHYRVVPEHVAGPGWCHACGAASWPCPTAQALGVME